MKLLGWMHRKLRQNNNEQLKDLISGQGFLDDQHYYPKPNFGNKNFNFKQHPETRFRRKSFTGSLESAKSNEEDDYGDQESAEAMSELFHGFLAIGTLGSEHGSMDDPAATPTFAYSVDYITKKETDVTEDELKLINDELEKVLAAEVKDESDSSTGRNSYVSAGRSSYGSTITLGGKSAEGQDTGNVCPLQEYLLGAAVERLSVSEMPEPPKVMAKKEHRTSLGELFQRTKMTDEVVVGEVERRSEKDSVMNLVKKKLKIKKMLSASSKSSAMAAGGGDSNSAEAKLHNKVMHMFHKKVHPEYSVVEKGSDQHQINEVKKKKSFSNDHMFSDEDIMIYPPRNFSRKSIRRIKSQSNPPQYALGEAESDVNREFWIKTDADYLVLEL